MMAMKTRLSIYLFIHLHSQWKKQRTLRYEKRTNFFFSFFFSSVTQKNILKFLYMRNFPPNFYFAYHFNFSLISSLAQSNFQFNFDLCKQFHTFFGSLFQLEIAKKLKSWSRHLFLPF